MARDQCHPIVDIVPLVLRGGVNRAVRRGRSSAPIRVIRGEWIVLESSGSFAPFPLQPVKWIGFGCGPAMVDAMQAGVPRSIYEFTRDELTALVASWNFSPVHAARLWSYVYHGSVTRFAGMAELPVRLRSRLEEELSLARHRWHRSCAAPTVSPANSC